MTTEIFEGKSLNAGRRSKKINPIDNVEEIVVIEAGGKTEDGKEEAGLYKLRVKNPDGNGVVGVRMALHSREARRIQKRIKSREKNLKSLTQGQ